MRVKLDENLPVSAAAPLRKSGHDVDTVADEGLTGAIDRAVLTAATRARRLLITLDRGLGDIRSYPPGTHAGVVVLRIDNQSPQSVESALARLCAMVDLETLTGCIGVWRAGLLRIRAAPYRDNRTEGRHS